MHFWRHLVHRLSPVLFVLSMVLFGIGAPLHAAPTARTSAETSISHCTESTKSTAINLSSISDCLSRCALPVPPSITMGMAALQSERHAAPLIAWQVISITPPSPPPRSDS
nr:hypothetical protein [uncultured Deefgea sp.]